MSCVDAIKIKKKRLHDKLAECFQVINTCLRTYYEGETHMYLPLAGQLRILFCDTNQGKEHGLLGRVFDGFALGPLDEIRWIDPGSVSVSHGYPYAINLDAPSGQEWQIAEMPFRITQYPNGLQVADLIRAEGKSPLSPSKWSDQTVTVYPIELTIRQIIRSVTDKDGGAHIDDEENTELRAMKRLGPAGLGVHVLYVVALARFAQAISLYYREFQRRFGYEGSLDNIANNWAPDEETLATIPREPEELRLGKREEFRLSVLKRVK